MRDALVRRQLGALLDILHHQVEGVLRVRLNQLEVRGKVSLYVSI